MKKFSIAVLILLLCWIGSSFADPLSDEKCLDCHGVSGFAVATGETGESPMRPLDINESALHDSVHGKIACIGCHLDIEKMPHNLRLLEVDCVTCHIRLDKNNLATKKQQARSPRIGRESSKGPAVSALSQRFKNSIHAKKDVKNNADCYTCHTAHYVYSQKDIRSLTHRENSPQMCGECHPKAYKKYRNSVHGATIKQPWKGESATCGDCHASHQIIQTEKPQGQRLLTEQCAKCHEKETDSYLATTHGQLAWLGNKDVAKCGDCHRSHATRAIKDPESLVSKQNELKTCKECHKDAGPTLIEFHSHGNTSNFSKYPWMFIIAKGMIALVIIVLIFFYSHSMLWLYREITTRPVVWQSHGFKSLRVRHKRVEKKGEQNFQRFPWYWRLNHWTLALSLMTLTFTGMTVMFPNTGWVLNAVEFAGGHTLLGLIHRIAGVIFVSAVTIHAIVTIIKVTTDKNFQWFGPDSLLPRKKDWQDMKNQYKWFFNKGEQPKFDRWTYWEKFDYWAVYWGAFIIGTSGFVLWFSQELMVIVPGWIFNIAALAHGLEAFLAVMTLFVVHFFNNHFRPYKFPLDTVMFTGSWDIEEFKEERPLHYQRLLASGELDKYLVAPPSKRINVLVHILGFSLLGTGLLLLLLVVIGFGQHGLP